MFRVLQKAAEAFRIVGYQIRAFVLRKAARPYYRQHLRIEYRPALVGYLCEKALFKGALAGGQKQVVVRYTGLFEYVVRPVRFVLRVCHV